MMSNFDSLNIDKNAYIINQRKKIQKHVKRILSEVFSLEYHDNIREFIKEIKTIIKNNIEGNFNENIKGFISDGELLKNKFEYINDGHFEFLKGDYNKLEIGYHVDPNSKKIDLLVDITYHTENDNKYHIDSINIKNKGYRWNPINSDTYYPTEKKNGYEFLRDGLEKIFGEININKLIEKCKNIEDIKKIKIFSDFNKDYKHSIINNENIIDKNYIIMEYQDNNTGTKNAKNSSIVQCKSVKITLIKDNGKYKVKKIEGDTNLLPSNITGKEIKIDEKK